MDEIVETVGFLLDWQAAESAAVVHMKTIGFIDARATGVGTDGGIDALSGDAAAQVKFYANPVGRPDVQRLRGAAHEYRLALFYSSGGYTKEAVAYATDAGVALFLMDPYGTCTPVSDLAELLVSKEEVEEREQRLEDLQSVQYGYAAAALESDQRLFVQFSETATLDSKEAALYSHVTTDIELLLRNFRSAVGSRDFAGADVIFEEIQLRKLFLSWTTGSALGVDSASLEEAVSAGWQFDATPGSEDLLQRVALGSADLRLLLESFLGGYEDTLTHDQKHPINEETSRMAGMLLVVSIDRSVLSPALLQQLKASMKVGLTRGRASTKKAFDSVGNLYKRLNMEQPRELIAMRLRSDSVFDRILRQLEASNR